MTTAAGEHARRASIIDPVGSVLAALAAAGILLQPFVTFRPNRIVSGDALGLFASLPNAAAMTGALVLTACAAIGMIRTGAWTRMAAGAAGLICLGILVGLAPAHLTAPDDRLARTGPGGGFWLLLFAFAILAADAAAKLAPRPLVRLALVGATAAAVTVFLVSGHWNALSVMREYATNAGSFWRQLGVHVALAVSSLAAALVVGIPLGIASARSPALAGMTLPLLNLIQTIPSIAMYGLMMVPLGLLASAWPLLRELGISGIGVAPAFIALFLYSLLPVVANVVAGLAQVPAKVVEAADGMGMTPGQRLFRIELPLALPVILTGVRIVLVQNIGLVTIAALIGGGGLGTFVFQGLGQAAADLVLLGAIPTIALAFLAAALLDAAIALAGGGTG